MNCIILNNITSQIKRIEYPDNFYVVRCLIKGIKQMCSETRTIKSTTFFDVMIFNDQIGGRSRPCHFSDLQRVVIQFKHKIQHLGSFKVYLIYSDGSIQNLNVYYIPTDKHIRVETLKITRKIFSLVCVTKNYGTFKLSLKIQ